MTPTPPGDVSVSSSAINRLIFGSLKKFCPSDCFGLLTPHKKHHTRGAHREPSSRCQTFHTERITDSMHELSLDISTVLVFRPYTPMYEHPCSADNWELSGLPGKSGGRRLPRRRQNYQIQIITYRDRPLREAYYTSI